MTCNPTLQRNLSLCIDCCQGPLQRTRLRAVHRIAVRFAACKATDAAADDYTWSGADEFDAEADRQDEPPLPLPAPLHSKTVTLVRHGQSQWNASGRIQGSSNLSLLTDKGRKQAEAARQQLLNSAQLEGEEFDAFCCSPLQRARVTGEIIWGSRDGTIQVLPALREVDLYSFQGLYKAEGEKRFGPQYHDWKRDPSSFEIDGHAPVRELWYRASLALRSILSAEPGRNTLVVAHNAINQALVAVALGLPPSAFRRLVQANAAITLLHFEPAAASGEQAGGGETSARAVLRHLNQSPEVLSGLVVSGVPDGALRLLLVACNRDGRTSGGGQHLEEATAAALSEFQVDRLVCDDTAAARSLQAAVADAQRVAALPPQLWHPTRLSDAELEASPLERRAIGEALSLCWQQSGHDVAAAGPAGRGGGGEVAQGGGAGHGAMTIAVLTSRGRVAALLHGVCGIGQEGAFAVELQPASISCVDLVAPPAADGGIAAEGATVHCVNSCAHLGATQSAAAVTDDGPGNVSDM